MSSNPAEVPPHVQQLVERWREEAQLALDMSEGRAWLTFWLTLTRLEKVTQEVLGLEVDRNARLPVTPDTMTRRMGEFEVPDTPPEADEGGEA